MLKKGSCQDYPEIKLLGAIQLKKGLSRIDASSNFDYLIPPPVGKIRGARPSRRARSLTEESGASSIRRLFPFGRSLLRSGTWRFESLGRRVFERCPVNCKGSFGKVRLPGRASRKRLDSHPVFYLQRFSKSMESLILAQNER